MRMLIMALATVILMGGYPHPRRQRAGIPLTAFEPYIMGDLPLVL